MKKINNVFQEKAIIALLHDVLTREDTIHKKSKAAPNGEAYLTNQYNLLVIIEMILKYMILFEDEKTVLSFATDLVQKFFRTEEEQERILYCNHRLVDQIQIRLNLSDQTSKENKRKILAFAYEKYIQEGYCFHSFPSTFEEVVTKEGLCPGYPISSLSIIEEINQIFEKHKMDYIFGRSMKSLQTDYIELTDSPFLAALYAFESPEYYNRFTSNGPIAKIKKGIDSFAYLRKDYEKISNNVEALCDETDLNPNEKDKVMKFVRSEWNLLAGEKMIPVMAMIKRKVVNQDDLKDYEKILDHCEEEELIYSFAKIMESRYTKENRYTKIIPAEFSCIHLPRYQELLDYEETIEDIVEELPPEMENEEEDPISNKHGSADVIAFTGLLLIALGLTWIVVSNYFKIH